MKIHRLPCPFCGGKAEVCVGLNNFDDVEIHCKKCCTSGPNIDNESFGLAGGKVWLATERESR